MSKRIGDVSTNPNIFAPSTTDLEDMIRQAMDKCDASIERAQDERMERALLAQTAARRAAFWRRP